MRLVENEHENPRDNKRIILAVLAKAAGGRIHDARVAALRGSKDRAIWSQCLDKVLASR